MNNFLIGIGKRIKTIRKEQKLTISEVATNAGVSNGLISRIENGRTIPSLPVLLELISALKIDASTFFRGIENSQTANYIHISKDQQQLIEKEVEAEGFTYHHLFSKSLSAIGFEAVILNIKPNSKREKVVTDAWEFKFIISGECTYLINNEEVLVSEGDSLYFDGRNPHVPINKSDKDCTMLVLYFYSENK
ncbi:helix-turn-helix domain-containing protein [Tenacibaculum aiptasiae]|uniref:helix-turn-helix domain-containing protein n=1 Tax=Tenacibaculum aiptasiae TaxID=426481 RepID=UPI00232E8A70|nr:XRE family transcriptional regulator [Tenacibaculum aiptasiae]